MELEEAFEKVDRIRMDFFDSKYKDVHTENELAEKYEALGTILQYIKYDAIPKKKIEDKIKLYKNMCARLGLAIDKETFNMFDNKIKVLEKLLEE